MLYVGDNNIKIFRFKKSEEYYRLMLDSRGFLIQAHHGIYEANFLEVANLLKTVDYELFQKLTENLNPTDPLYTILKAKI